MRRILPVLTAVLVVFGTLTDGAWAQSGSVKYPQDIQGVWYVVTTDEAVMRAGKEEVYYAVARYPKGTMIVASESTDLHASVYYPLALGALVPVGEVDQGADGKVTLIAESMLRAPSSLLGMSGSWKALYSKALPAGTQLEVLEELRSSNDQLVGYRVRAPRPPVSSGHPIGFINMGDLRLATTNEVESFLGNPVTQTPIEDDQPDTRATDLEPVEIEDLETIDSTTGSDTENAAQDAGDPIDQDAESDNADPENIDTSLLDDMVEPKTEETQNTQSSDPAETDPASDADDTDDTPITIQNALINAEKSGQPVANNYLSAAALETLESAFNEARSLPRAQLDDALEELLAEFTRAHDAAGDDASLARALNQRMEWIKIRMETRDQRRAIESTLRKSDAEQIAIAGKIKEWQSGQSYIIVGRLVRSAVYTGERLPLLYRVQGTNELTGMRTTIGYMSVAAGEDYRSMLGRVVGVIGTSEMDGALNMKIIHPVRIDVMPE